MMVLTLAPEEARLLEKLKGRGKWTNVTSRTSPGKLLAVRDMLLRGESKHRIIQDVRVGIATVHNVETQLKSEGLL